MREKCNRNGKIAVKLFLIFIILLVMPALSSCGFRILNKKNQGFYPEVSAKKINNTISGIYIKPFKNLTYKSGIGAYFSVSLANYLNTSTYMFTSNKDNAAYYLTGRITSIQNSVISYTGIAAAVNYNIMATVMVSLYGTDGKIIFRNIKFSSTSSYFNYINPLTAHEQEKKAIKTVSKRIARKIAIYIESKSLMSKK